MSFLKRHACKVINGEASLLSMTVFWWLPVHLLSQPIGYAIFMAFGLLAAILLPFEIIERIVFAPISLALGLLGLIAVFVFPYYFLKGLLRKFEAHRQKRITLYSTAFILSHLFFSIPTLWASYHLILAAVAAVFK